MTCLRYSSVLETIKASNCIDWLNFVVGIVPSNQTKLNGFLSGFCESSKDESVLQTIPGQVQAKERYFHLNLFYPY